MNSPCVFALNDSMAELLSLLLTAQLLCPITHVTCTASYSVPYTPVICKSLGASTEDFGIEDSAGLLLCSIQIVSPIDIIKIVSEYDQEKPQSQIADNPMAPRGRAAQPSRDTREKN